jgi:hypothetical protein
MEDQQQQQQQQEEEVEEEEDLTMYLNMFETLRNEPFNQETNEKLMTHPYLLAAKDGTLTLAQRRAFVGEQYAIQYSDARSFARLAGHDGSTFHLPSTTLSSVTEIPSPSPSTIQSTTTASGNAKDLFQFLLEGEIYASRLLLDHAKSLGVPTEKDLRAYPITGKAQAYPSYWARLALSDHGRVIGAAACAVNFPTWGTMCSELSKALKRRPESYYYGHHTTRYDDDDDDDDETKNMSLAFIDFFGTPIDDLDVMAARVMKQQQQQQRYKEEESSSPSYEDISTGVRLLQEYEVMFWDAIFEAKE